jgi:hypothetical protein
MSSISGDRIVFSLALAFDFKISSLTITGEGLQNFGLCSALRAFEQGGIFIVPHLM